MSYPEALGILELTSIARGWRVLDDMIKRAPARVRAAHPISSGKFLIFLEGDLASVEEALGAGRRAASRCVAGDVLLTRCHSAVWAALDGALATPAIDALGVVESLSIADTILGADAAMKAAQVQLVALRMGQGIDGKGYFAVAGSLSEVEAAIDDATQRMRSQQIIELELLARPHEEMTRALLNLTTIHDPY
jgi:microcompartment protein CcmL/EutN